MVGKSKVETLLNIVLKNKKMEYIYLDINPENKPSYSIEKNIIFINNENTLKTLSQGFHEFGHAFLVKNKKKKNSKYMAFLKIWLSYAQISLYIGIIGSFLSIFCHLNSFIITFIFINLIITFINLFFLLKEEFLASKIGYENIKEMFPVLKKRKKIKILIILLNGFSSYLYFLFLAIVAIFCYFI
jgi:hypothetical protein